MQNQTSSAPPPQNSLSPTPQTPEEWRDHWKSLGKPWRTKPEISEKRKKELETYRAHPVNIQKGEYPFSGKKLTRADIEWLLETHEHGSGPVVWSDESQRTRMGLDLRGADLSEEGGQPLNLADLPLARLVGGLDYKDPFTFTDEQRKQACVKLTDAILFRAQLEGAILTGAQLEGAILTEAQLERAILTKAQLEGATLDEAQLEGAIFIAAQLREASLDEAKLQGAILTGAQLEGAYLTGAQLQGAVLAGAQLKGANLTGANLEDADLSEAQLEKADLTGAQLGKTDLRKARLDEANLSNAILANNKRVGPYLTGIQWGTIDLTSTDDWPNIALLGDEQETQQKRHHDGSKKDKQQRFNEYRAAVRANRQLSVILRTQGLNEEATQFAYHSQALQKNAYWLQMIQSDISFRQWMHAFGGLLLSWLMFLIAGYGYKFWRSIITYLIFIIGFAALYYLFGSQAIVSSHGQQGPHLSPIAAVVVSMTAFHGRGFFTGAFSADDPQAILAAIEAFFGLLIEVTFIATLTRRLFSN